MGYSRLTKDLASSNVDLESVFFRLRIILNDIDDIDLMEWIKGEMSGYEDYNKLPDYRILHGEPIGTFFTDPRVKHSNVNVPVETILNSKEIDNIKKIALYMSISNIQRVLNSEERDSLSIQIPTAYCHSISTQQLQIIKMNIPISSVQLGDIISKVKNKLLQIILELEKRFDGLDDLDISFQLKNDEEKQKLSSKFNQIVNNNYIEIGDGNKISNSEIGHLLQDDDA